MMWLVQGGQYKDDEPFGIDMDQPTKITRALISVYDKSGLLELAAFLQSREIDILSSGGTAKFFRGSKYTGNRYFQNRIR